MMWLLRLAVVAVLGRISACDCDEFYRYPSKGN